MRRWQSGQLHLTVNQTPSGYVGSNPTRRTIFKFCDKIYLVVSITIRKFN